MTERDYKAVHWALTFDPYYRHESDNSFIHCGFQETLNDAAVRGYQLIGVGLAPFPHMNQYYMSVWQENDDIFWCHISETVYNLWIKESEGRI